MQLSSEFEVILAMEIESAEQPKVWVMSTKRPGDRVGAWFISELIEQNTRYTEKSERCAVTSYCYPSGAKLVQAFVYRD